jgi:hypothetical protein
MNDSAARLFLHFPQAPSITSTIQRIFIEQASIFSSAHEPFEGRQDFDVHLLPHVLVSPRACPNDKCVEG